MLLVASAEDRLLPSLMEASRIQRLVPQALRVVRSRHTHTPSLEPHPCCGYDTVTMTLC